MRKGAGAYICGEETAVFGSIEGYRGEPRNKPPFPVVEGLFRHPTVVNNVETLVNVLPIVLEGGPAFAQIGSEKSTGPKLFCVSGAVGTPGTYEVPFGTTLRELLDLAGGVTPNLQAVLLGGAAGGFLTPDDLDLRLTIEDAREFRTTLGSGVVLAIDDTVDLGRLLMVIAAFMRDESCGQCVPCRVGHRAPGGGGRAPAVGPHPRQRAGRDRPHPRDRPGHARRVDLRPRPDRLVRDRVRHRATGSLHDMTQRTVSLTIDDQPVEVAEGATILEACEKLGIDTPTLCYGDTLQPANVCRVCVVEIEGGRVLAPACSRKAEDDMVVKTDSERVRHSRKMVMEFLGSSVDLSITPPAQEYIARYDADPARYGPPAPPDTGRDRRRTGHHEEPDGQTAATVHQPVKVDNDLYVRDYSKCILCYKCVDACGDQWQNTFAITVAGRGFDARISTEYANPLPDSACVYCGNCIAVCPTGALMFASEHELRDAAQWDEERQTQADTVCPYCGVGCNLTLHVQDNQIVKVSSPDDHDITRGNLCIKGRFGFQHVQPHSDRG